MPVRISPGGIPDPPGTCLPLTARLPQPNGLGPCRRCLCGTARRAPAFAMPCRVTFWPPWYSGLAKARTRSCHRTCRLPDSDWPFSAGSRVTSRHASCWRIVGCDDLFWLTSKKRVAAAAAFTASRRQKSTIRQATGQTQGRRPAGIRSPVVQMDGGIGDRHVRSAHMQPADDTGDSSVLPFAGDRKLGTGLFYH